MTEIPLPRRSPYLVMGSRETVTIHLTADFWADAVNPDGQSQFDGTVDAVLAELRYAFYAVAVLDRPTH